MRKIFKNEKPMKIALFGHGKMGQLVEKMAQKNGHQICAIVTRQSKIVPQISKADLAIDFSHHSCVFDNLSACLSLKKPIVIGTTGWEEQLPEAKKLVAKEKGSCLYAPNFSIGIFLFRQILRCAAKLFQPFEEYDVCGIESHHKEKKDSPSGTAKAISQDLQTHLPRLGSFNFASVRCGHIPGTHAIHFDSPSDTLSLTHEARNREAFAHGALMAAEWLRNKHGFFSFEEMMDDILSRGNQ